MNGRMSKRIRKRAVAEWNRLPDIRRAYGDNFTPFYRHMKRLYKHHRREGKRVAF